MVKSMKSTCRLGRYQWKTEKGRYREFDGVFGCVEIYRKKVKVFLVFCHRKYYNMCKRLQIALFKEAELYD